MTVAGVAADAEGRKAADSRRDSESRSLIEYGQRELDTDHRPLVFGHRGGSRLAPENTMAAFDRAVAEGVDGLELDVRLSKDGGVMVCHDARVDRTSNSEAGGRETVRQIVDAGGRAVFLLADVGVEEQSATGRVRRANLWRRRPAGQQRVGARIPGKPCWPAGSTAVQTDLLGTMYATWHAIPAMRRRGGGAIVNIGSTSALGHGAKPSASPGYDVAKAGVLRLATMLAPLAAAEKIRVNCLVPDWVATPEVQGYWDSLTPDERAEPGRARRC